MTGRVVNLIKEYCPDYVWFSSWEMFLLLEYVSEEEQDRDFGSYESLKVIINRLYRLGVLDRKKITKSQWHYKNNAERGQILWLYKVK